MTVTRMERVEAPPSVARHVSRLSHSLTTADQTPPERGNDLPNLQHRDCSIWFVIDGGSNNYKDDFRGNFFSEAHVTLHLSANSAGIRDAFEVWI